MIPLHQLIPSCIVASNALIIIDILYYSKKGSKKVIKQSHNNGQQIRICSKKVIKIIITIKKSEYVLKKL